MIASAKMFIAANQQMALSAECIVASVDYRLAPETIHPGPIEDCYKALKWLHDNAKKLNVDQSRIAITGESAGGGLAAALALLARDRGEVHIAHQHLISPMLDDRTCVSDVNPYAGEFVWTPGSNRYGWSSLLGGPPGGDGVSAYAAAARATDLRGLPSTFIAVGALDLFAEENMEYAGRLLRAGIPTELHNLSRRLSRIRAGSRSGGHSESPPDLLRGTTTGAAPPLAEPTTPGVMKKSNSAPHMAMGLDALNQPVKNLKPYPRTWSKPI